MNTPPPAKAESVSFHVEEQEVIYYTSAIDASDTDAARILVVEAKSGEVVGHQLVSRLVTNIHPVTDKCGEHGCYGKSSEE